MTVEWDASDLIARVRRGAQRGIVAATEDIRTEVTRLIIQTAKTGRIYRRRSVTHQASAPGEPPASDTGRLVGSLRTEYDFDHLKGTLMASTSYAGYLEFGTQRMAPRPFMRPALVNRKDEVEKLVARAIRAELGGALT